MSSILIKNGLVITMNPSREIISDGAISMENNKIVDIGKTDELKKLKKMNKKISLTITYPPHMKKHEYKIKISPEKAIDLIKKEYRGWIVVREDPSGKFVTTDLDKIRYAESVYLYFPLAGG